MSRRCDQDEGSDGSLTQTPLSFRVLHADIVAEHIDKCQEQKNPEISYVTSMLYTFNSGYVTSYTNYLAMAYQLHSLRALFFGLQETGARSACAARKVGPYLRYSSKRDIQGHAVETYID